MAAYVWLRQRWSLTMILAVLCTGLGSVVGTTLVVLWLYSGPSVRTLVVDEADMLVSPDDSTISIVVKVEREYNCPVQVARFLWQWVDYKGRRMRRFRSIDNPPLTPEPEEGVNEYMLTFDIPISFPPGEYYQRTVVSESCSWFGRVGRTRPVVYDRGPVIKEK